ncbi:transmembrane protein 254 isoform X1 [Salvelinus fontinalis]|uniref:transmembrane protein 254 isoform X1 n=1 Tax=Salvelinus fontinalis TaxID=8038 RepID=UPI0024850BD4|nr:transmembrane protein 254 isoform X1 [Salvelinus fontinalis]
MAKSDGCHYFRRTSIFWITIVALSMGYFTLLVVWGEWKNVPALRNGKWTVFWPQQVPYDNLGPLGTLSRYLVNNYHSLMYKGWWAAWVIHVAEALVAMKVCSDKGVDGTMTRCLWFVQTALFGFASLGLLLKYKPDHRTKQH